MTVAYDNESSLAVGTGDRNWNHAGGASARAALVIVYDGVTTDQVVGVTYGGTTMTEVSGSPLIQSGGEGGSVHVFFLDNCGTGTKNVAIDRGDATNYGACCWTVTGTEIYVHNTNTSTSTSDSTPDALLTITRPSFVAGGIYSGINSVTTSAPAVLSGEVATGAADFGTDGGQGARGDSIKTGNFTFGWTQAADDATLFVIALADRVIDATVADSVASLSDSPARTASNTRTGSDALTSLAEAVSGAKILNRSTSDALASLAESVSRGTLAATRATSDAVASLSESLTRDAMSIARTSADAISSLSDAVARAAMEVTRDTSDQLVSLAEEASRAALELARTSADALDAISDVASRSTAEFARAIEDALSTLSELVDAEKISGGPHEYPVTVADALASLAETVGRAETTFTRREWRPTD